MESTGAAETPPPHEHEDADPAWRFMREFGILTISAPVIAVLIKSFLIQAFYIPSGSMVPTLQVGDRVLVNKLTYRFHPPGRGDVIVFEDPNAPPVDRGPVSGFVHWVTDGLGLVTSPDKDFIKRVIGLPGDSIEIRRGRVYVTGTEPRSGAVPEPRSRMSVAVRGRPGRCRRTSCS